MTDDQPIRDDRAGLFTTLGKVVARLSPEFLGLLVVDAVFMLAVVYLFHAQNASRERVLGPVLNSCIEAVPLDALKMLAKPETSGLQETMGNVRQQLTDARSDLREQTKQVEGLRQQIDLLRPAIDTLRNELTRDTRARLQGPAR